MPRKWLPISSLCVDTAMGTIYTQATFLQNYQQADIEKAKVWREALDNSSARLAETLKNYKDANGNPLPASSLDLGALAQQNALPDSVGRRVHPVCAGLPGSSAGAGE